MNKIISLPKLTALMANATGTDSRVAERFILDFTALIADALTTDDVVKIKGLGQFAKVSAGDKVKIAFLPDREIAQHINAPFAFFEPVILADSVTDELLAEAANIAPKKDETADRATEDTAVTVESANDAENIAMPMAESADKNEAEPAVPADNTVDTTAELKTAGITEDEAPVETANTATLPEDTVSVTEAPAQQNTPPAYQPTVLPPAYIPGGQYSQPADNTADAAGTDISTPPQLYTEPLTIDPTDDSADDGAAQASAPEADNTDTGTIPATPVTDESDPQSDDSTPAQVADELPQTEQDAAAEVEQSKIVYLTEERISWFWVIVSGILGILIGFAIGHFTYDDVSAFMSSYTQSEPEAVTAPAPTEPQTQQADSVI